MKHRRSTPWIGAGAGDTTGPCWHSTTLSTVCALAACAVLLSTSALDLNAGAAVPAMMEQFFPLQSQRQAGPSLTSPSGLLSRDGLPLYIPSPGPVPPAAVSSSSSAHLLSSCRDLPMPSHTSATLPILFHSILLAPERLHLRGGGGGIRGVAGVSTAHDIGGDENGDGATRVDDAAGDAAGSGGDVERMLEEARECQENGECFLFRTQNVNLFARAPSLSLSSERPHALAIKGHVAWAPYIILHGRCTR